MNNKFMISVAHSKFHASGTIIVYYQGYSKLRAVQAARKINCTELRCGGPTIVREDGAHLMGWEAAKPRRRSNHQRWSTHDGQ